MKTSRKGSLLLMAITLLVVCSSWGFLMHRTINQLAVYQLPKEMQPFFYGNMEYIVKNSIRPDDRRSSDPTEASKHFIDFEAYGDDAANKMPMDWNEAVARYTKDTLLKYGYVPYWVIVMKDRLVNAFRDKNRDSILFYATDLGHYIEDANVPLHTSVNYDGQLTDQRGIHALWESVVPELTIESFKLNGHKKASYLKSPEKEIWKAVRQAHILLPEVLQAERDVTVAFTDSTKYRIQKRNGREVKYYTRDFALAYAKKLEPAIAKQAVRSSNLLADFWYTAWVDGGKPDLDKLMIRQLDTAAQLKLADEVKAYRKNQLLKKDWLISKRDAVSDPAGN